MSLQIYYGVCTKLAFEINENYYGGKHFGWFAPYFHEPSAPPSSNPHDIYYRFEEDSRRMDEHSTIIKENRSGIIRGANFMLKNSTISSSTFNDITRLAKRADFQKFQPILMIVPLTPTIQTKLTQVPLSSRAGSHSMEYQIAGIDKTEFQAIRLKY